ncbi:carbohydrate ABC transporter permease [Harryflintia acetispora]|uniref:Multiple sugar transport system permease protein n=1 Tax=Harryflintia acetispora TaxID=1849041 RepID=A0A9X8UIN4_9FIRM|nr:sugar ABC transporter permease [Harryflintia acetispora]TCL42439.1 multiple sugar transport system permease protein [Harryflintia acetispora]
MKAKKKRNWRKWEPYLLLAPGLLLIVLLMGYPLLYSVRLSFLNYNLLTPNDIHFNGLENYQKLFSNPDLWLIVKNSIIWVVVVVFFQFLLGFTLAMLLNSQFRGKGLYQSVAFLPWAVSGFLIGLTFKWLFSQHNGVINFALQSLGLIDAPVSWLGSETFSMIVPIVGMIWYGVPFFGIMILAALQSIPVDVIESAKIDGASATQTFFKVMIPYVRPTITVTLLLRVIWVFNSPDIIYITTAGGPANTSNILPLYVFNQAYYSMDFGYGAAAGILMMEVLLIYAMLYLKLTSYEKAGDF